MKKTFFLFILSFMALALMGCSSTPQSEASNAKPIAAATDEKKAEVAPVPTPTPTTTVAKATTPIKPKVAPPSAPKLVTISGFTFKPSRLIINKGETVKWVNKDGVMHTVTSASFKSEILNQNNFFSQTFTKPGTYSYKCNFHSDMVGSIIVKQ